MATGKPGALSVHVGGAPGARVQHLLRLRRRESRHGPTLLALAFTMAALRSMLRAERTLAAPCDSAAPRSRAARPRAPRASAHGQRCDAAEAVRAICGSLVPVLSSSLPFSRSLRWVLRCAPWRSRWAQQPPLLARASRRLQMRCVRLREWGCASRALLYAPARRPPPAPRARLPRRLSAAPDPPASWWPPGVHPLPCER